MIVTLSKGSFVGDEIFMEENYKFSVVALTQPTFLYVIENTKLVTATAILGRHVIAEISERAAEKIKYRLSRLKAMEQGSKKRAPSHLDTPKKRPNLHFFNVKATPARHLDEQFK